MLMKKLLKDKMRSADDIQQCQRYEARIERQKQLYMAARRRMEMERALTTPFARAKMFADHQRRKMEAMAACTPVRYDVDSVSFSTEELTLFQERMDIHEKMIHDVHASSESSD